MSLSDEEPSMRVNLRIPTKTFHELAEYATRSGVSRSQFILHGAIIGCRLLDQMSFPQYHLSEKQIKAAMESMGNTMIDRIGGGDELKRRLFEELDQEE